MAKKELCPKCGKKHDGKCKPKKGSYGLDQTEIDDDAQEINTLGGSLEDSSSMSERREFNVDIDMKDMSSENKKRALDDFRRAANEAKKRKADQEKNAAVRAQRREKGMRFYDKKGSGYIVNGKKKYD